MASLTEDYFRHILKNACSLEIQFLQNLREEELEELPEGELNFHMGDLAKLSLQSFQKKSGDCNPEIYLYFVISRRNPECVWGNVQEKAEEEILLSKCIESWKSGKKEEGAGLLEAYFRKMAEKLAALHKGQ